MGGRGSGVSGAGWTATAARGTKASPVCVRGCGGRYAAEQGMQQNRPKLGNTLLTKAFSCVLSSQRAASRQSGRRSTLPGALSLPRNSCETSTSIFWPLACHRGIPATTHPRAAGRSNRPGRLASGALAWVSHSQVAAHGSGGACEFKLAHAAPRRACPSGSPPTGACHSARDGSRQSRRTPSSARPGGCLVIRSAKFSSLSMTVCSARSSSGSPPTSRKVTADSRPDMGEHIDVLNGLSVVSMFEWCSEQRGVTRPKLSWSTPELPADRLQRRSTAHCLPPNPVCDG